VKSCRLLPPLLLATGDLVSMETAANPSADRAVVERCASKQRSRVTNGKTLFVEADQRGPWARRWRDVLAEITNDLGGADLLSEGQKQLARRCATISIACERMEGEAALGNEIDLDAYGTLTDRLGRALQRLGLKRIAKDITPSLADIMREAEGAHEMDEPQGAHP
jgi:hypothetical protein